MRTTPPRRPSRRAADSAPSHCSASASPVEIGNRVWLDADLNGRQDPDEPAINGAPVQLWTADAAGAPECLIGTTTRRHQRPAGHLLLQVGHCRTAECALHRPRRRCFVHHQHELRGGVPRGLRRSGSGRPQCQPCRVRRPDLDSPAAHSAGRADHADHHQRWHHRIQRLQPRGRHRPGAGPRRRTRRERPHHRRRVVRARAVPGGEDCHRCRAAGHDLHGRGAGCDQLPRGRPTLGRWSRSGRSRSAGHQNELRVDPWHTGGQ